jgi:very-short-patch-repair endonuclease
MSDRMSSRVSGQRADAAIRAFAAKQHGIVTRRQLLSDGIKRHLVDWRVRSGMLEPVHSGVYRVGPVAAPHAREMAAVLACPGAVLSHRSAAALWQLVVRMDAAEPIHITVASEAGRGRRPGIRRHRADLTADEVQRLGGLPVTTVARTLVDLSRTVEVRELERAFARAERERLVTRSELRALLERYARRGGTRRLAALVASRAGAAFTRSEAEEQLHRLLEQGGVTGSEANVVVCGYEVDRYWKRARVAIEVDGIAYHSSATAILRDRRRDSALAAAGIQVLRMTWHQIVNEREKTLVQIAQVLARAEERASNR